MAVALARVSVAEVGTRLILHTKVVPAGLVPVLVKVVKLTVAEVGQELVAVVAVMAGAVVPAAQGPHT